MPKIRVTCPTCATPLELDAEYAGQEVQCGSCHQIFVAKAEKRSRPGGDEDEDRPSRRKSKFRREVDDDEDDLDDRPRRRRRRSGSDGGGSGAGTASLVLGLFGIIAWCCPLIGFPVTLIGLILGCVGLKAENKGMAIAGIVLNVIFFLATLANAIAGAAMNVAGWNNRNPWNQQPNNPPPWNQPGPRNFR